MTSDIKSYFQSLSNGGGLLSNRRLSPLIPEEVNGKLAGCDLYATRVACVRKFCFPIPSQELINALLLLSPLIEIGAGTGFLAKLLVEKGAEVIATDAGTGAYSQKIGAYFPILRLKAPRAINRWPRRNVLCSWPSYTEEWAHDALCVMSKDRTFAYIGEGSGGCTASDGFHSFVEKHCEADEISIVSWPFIHDNLYLIRKAPGR